MFHSTVVPATCQSQKGYTCLCHYYREMQANVYNCSSESLTRLPNTIHPNATWLAVGNTRLRELCEIPSYFDKIWYLNVANNNLSSICKTFIKYIINQRKLKWLNLKGNSFTTFPKEMTQLNYTEKLWLSENPIHCDCSMTWIIGWLNNFTTPSGEHVIEDYRTMRCHTGMMKGKLLYLLDQVEMGCFPSKWTIWQKVGVGMGAVIAVAAVTISIIATKRSREVKFLMYYYLRLDTVPKDDKNENVNNMEYDAYFCYR